MGGRGFWKTTGVNPAFPVKLAGGKSHAFEFVFGDDFAAARQKGLVPRIEVRVLTDLDGDRPPTLKIRGAELACTTQKDGVATFIADDATFVKGANPVEIAAPEAMTLHDFSVKVEFPK